MRLAPTLLALLFGVCAGVTAAKAEVNDWRTPGLHPLSASADGRDQAAIDCAATGLSVPRDVSRKFREAIARGVKGVIVPMKDGDRFRQQAYEKCAVWDNVQVAWGIAATQDRRMEVITIVADDGTVVKYGRPFVCDNWSIIDVAPPPPRGRCFRIYFDYSHTDGAELRTIAALQAAGQWRLSQAQAYLNGDVPVASILMHVDVTAAEAASREWKECFGVGDETGFHSETMECDSYCQGGGRYPPLRFIKELARQKGIELPEREPNWSAMVACAHGKCYVQFPLFVANRPGIFCVGVAPYHSSVSGFRIARSYFDFDQMNPPNDPDQGARSLALQRASRADAELLGANGRRRYLSGEDSF